jgi:hypothetical protein
MSPLEQRYRALLRWLPEPARSRWADDMTGTYLSLMTTDDPEYAEFGSPSLTDRLDVAGLALRLRLGAPGASVRAVATGRAVRLVAVAGTVALAWSALLGLASQVWLLGLLPFLPAPHPPGRVLWTPREALSAALAVLTVALAVCVVRSSAGARPLAVALLGGEALSVLTWWGPLRPVDLLPLLTVAVPLVAAAVLPVGPPAVRPGRLVVLPVLTFGPWALTVLLGQPPGWLLGLSDPAVQEALVLAGAAVVVLLRRRPGRGPGELAVAVLSVAVLPTLLARWPYQGTPGYHPLVVAATAGVAVAAVVTGAVGWRAVRTLPVDATAGADHP